MPNAFEDFLKHICINGYIITYLVACIKGMVLYCRIPGIYIYCNNIYMYMLIASRFECFSFFNIHNVYGNIVACVKSSDHTCYDGVRNIDICDII